ncbi:predicted protein [Uncinocarpus reesii 1704]|uniref:Uncharacterized protein n=1 Tax=Uncinocarpus reesii (strain UAMH 1704) TaxID=336963 RepID=C4JSY6_UNCRE|nr:uncharacterized protein UREG_05575 [Uncinocarpus reesii 1704]EEP80733.1 predicted protein [Uncinocarpus reesii 1704]
MCGAYEIAMISRETKMQNVASARKEKPTIVEQRPKSKFLPALFSRRKKGFQELPSKKLDDGSSFVSN